MLQGSYVIYRVVLYVRILVDVSSGDVAIVKFWLIPIPSFG